jgi:hypothetical protein
MSPKKKSAGQNKILLKEPKTYDNGTSRMIFKPGEYNMQGSPVLEELAVKWLAEGFEVCCRPGDEPPPPPPPPEPEEPEPEVGPLPEPDSTTVEE